MLQIEGDWFVNSRLKLINITYVTSLYEYCTVKNIILHEPGFFMYSGSFQSRVEIVLISSFDLISAVIIIWIWKFGGISSNIGQI